MKYTSVLVVLWAVVAIGCTKGDPKPSAEPGGEVNEVPSRNPAAVESSQLPARATPGAEQKQTVKGKAVVQGTDGAEGGEGDITLTLSDRGEVSGSLAIGELVLGIQGVKEGDNLRLWAVNENEDGDNVRRGFVFAQLLDGRYGGDFALSGNGGKPSLRGTWSQVD